MAQLHTIIIQSEHKVLAELKTDKVDEQLLLDWLGIDQPEWYPIQGGWLVTNRYSKSQNSMLNLIRPYGFVYAGVHYPHNAIIVQGKLKSFYMNQDMDTDFMEYYMDQITFYDQGYDPDHDQTIDTTDF